MNKLKRIAAVILALSLCMTLIPAAVFADAEPDSYVSIITLDNGQPLSRGYLYRSDGKKPSTILGASYDASSNTLTLDGSSFNGSSRFIETNKMGSDFKICIRGNVSLANIVVYSGSLSLTGDGTLSVNENHDGYLFSGSYAAIDVEGEQTAATLTIGPDVTVHACGFDKNSRAIFVSNTSASAGGIVIGGRLSGGQVNSKRHLSYVAADEGTENSVNGNLYTKDGSPYIIQTIYNNGVPFYNIYSVAVSGGKYTSPSLVNSDRLSEIPDGYNPVYSDYYSWTISSDSNFLNNQSEVLIAASTSETYTVEYNANYTDGPAPLSQEKLSGMELALLGADAFSRPGYVFSGWNTAADGSGSSYEPGSRYTADASLKLYAQWTPVLYSVIFDLNGGVGTAEAQENISYGSSITLPGAPDKTGHKFLGWKTGETTYPAGAEYTVTENTAFSASWEEIKTILKVPGIDSYEALSKHIIVHGDYDYYIDAKSEVEIDPNCNATTAELIFYDSFSRPTTVSTVTVAQGGTASFDTITWGAQKYTLSLIPEGMTGYFYSEENGDLRTAFAEASRDYYFSPEEAASLVLHPQLTDAHSASEYVVVPTVDASISGNNITFELRKHTLDASLSGTVTSGGMKVAGAVVSVTQTLNSGTSNESTLSYSTVTGKNGSYSLSKLAAGSPADIRVEADGYASFKTTHPALSSGSNQHAEIVLSKTGIIKVVSDNEISEAKFLVNGVAAKADSTFGSSFTVTIPEGVAAPLSVTVQSPVIKDGSITVSVSVSDGIGYAYLSPQLRGKLDWSKVVGGSKIFAILDQDGNTTNYIQCYESGFIYLNEGSYSICTANQHIPYSAASRDAEYYKYVTKEITGADTIYLENEDFPDSGVPVLAGSVNAPADASENELFEVTGIIQSTDAEIVKLEAILSGGKLAGFSVNGKLAVNTNVHEDYALIEKDNEKNLKLDWGTPLSYTVYVSMGNKQQSVDIYATVKDSAGKTTKAYVGTAITSLNPGLTLNVPNKVGGEVDANGILQPSSYRFSGTAPAGTLVKLYDNNEICAAVTADQNNRYEGSAVLNSCMKSHIIRAEMVSGASTYTQEKLVYFEASGAVLKEITLNGISVTPGGSAAAYAATPHKVYEIEAFFENGNLLSDQSLDYGGKTLEGKVIFRVATIGNTYYYAAEKKSDNRWGISIRLGLEYPTSIKVLYKTDAKSSPTIVPITTTEGETVDIEVSAALQIADADGNSLAEAVSGADWTKFFTDVYDYVHPSGSIASLDNGRLLGSVMPLFAAAPSSTQLAFEDVMKLIDGGNANEEDLAEGYMGATLVSASNAQDITRSDAVQIIQYYDNPTYVASSFVYRNSELKGKGYEVQTLENGKKQYILYKGTFYYDSFAYPTTGPTETYIDGGVRKTRDNPKMYNKDGEIIGSKLKVLYLYSVSDNKWYRMQEATVGVNSKPPIFTHVNQIPGTEPPYSYSSVAVRTYEPQLLTGVLADTTGSRLLAKMPGTTFCGLRLNINPKKISAKTWASAGAAATNYGISKLTSKLNTKLKTFKIEETERELLTKVVSDGKTHYLKHYQTVTTTWTLESNHVAAGAISPSLAFLPNSIQGSSPATLPEAFNTLRSKLTNELRRYTELGAKYPDNVSIPYLKKDIGKLLNQLTDLEELLDTAKTQNEFTENVGNGLTYLSMLCSFDFANGAEEAACVDSINIFFNAANDTANEDTIDALADFILRYDAYRDFANTTNQTLGDDENKPSGGGSGGGSFGDSSESSNSSYDHNYDADAVFNPVHDPSGIVYEAVLSNPVEGAQVTLYNAQKADGSLILEDDTSAHGSAIMRVHDDAPYLKQQNPVVTGADGVYQWFVPSGLWYVEASKAGYSSGDSSKDVNATVSANGTKYMPVLPPQLNVNIPLVDTISPYVSEEIYRPEGIYITFSKYMDESTLIASNFKVDGLSSGFTVEKLDSEEAPDNINYDGTAPSYTKSILLRYDSEKASGTETALEISSALMSYAGSHLTPYAGSGTAASASPLPSPAYSIRPGSAVEVNTPLSLSCEDSSAKIYYTTDGSVPTAEAKLYNGPIVVTRNMTIKAIAVRTGYTDSSVAEGSYTIVKNGTIAPPPSGGGASSASSNAVKPVEKINFVDVPESAYYHDAVVWAVSKGITSGMDEKHFAPLNITTRDQMVTFLWRTVGKPEPTITEIPFTDLDPDKYYYKAALWAYENGITDGTSATTFEPNKNVSRAQTVTFLWRYAGKPVADYFMNMSDVASGNYYNEAVRWALSEKITDGTTTTTFSPNDDCLRGQIVTFLYRDFAK